MLNVPGGPGPGTDGTADGTISLSFEDLMQYAQPLPTKSPSDPAGSKAVPVRGKPINPELEDRYVSPLGASTTRLKSVSMDEFHVLNTSAGSDDQAFPDLLGASTDFATISDQVSRFFFNEKGVVQQYLIKFRRNTNTRTRF